MLPRHAQIALLLLGISGPLAAQDGPLWEAGLGAGAVWAPDYRGADEGRGYLLPIPYFYYQGEYLRVDREGARARVFETARIATSVSASLGPPADSEDNEARAGMEDLLPTVEIGPSVNILFHENAARDRSWYLRLPLRFAVATDLSEAQYIGVVFLPHVSYVMRNVGPTGGWRVGLSAGLVYGSEKYHEYFYGVSSEFATPTRPAYDAHGGYSGVSAGVTITRRYPKYWIGAFARYDNLSGTVFEDSPLVRTKNWFVAGVAVSRILAQSKRP